MRVVIVSTHPIQYQAPLFRKLAGVVDLKVIFMMRQTPGGQAASGFGVEFEWDIPLLQGYSHVFAANIAKSPSTNAFNGIVLQDHGSLLESIRPDVVMIMGWFPRSYLQIIRWAAQNKVPLVCRGESNLVSGRSMVKRFLKFFYFRWLFGKFQSFAVIGKRNREFYRHYGVPEQRLCMAPYSIDTEFFSREFARYRPAKRRPGPWRLGFAGKLIPKKRPWDLIEAVSQCNRPEDIELVFLGDGPLRDELVKRASETKIKMTIRGFLNQTAIVPQGYADLDALILPSGDYETWGLVVNEAMSGGIPAIVSDKVGCAPDLLEEGQTGYVFPSSDITALSGCIERLVGRLETGHDFGPAVLERVKHYSMDETIKGLVEALHFAMEPSVSSRA